MSGTVPLWFLSEAQMEIMLVVWDLGEATVADVWKVLSERRGVSRTTVLTMLKRLEKKGWLNRHKEGRAFRYQATLPRDPTLGTMVRRLVEAAFGGSVEALVTAFLHAQAVSKKEARSMEKMFARTKSKAS